MQITSIISDGKIHPSKQCKIDAYLEKYEGKRISIKVERMRSVEQNKYYWGVIVEELSKHTGHTPEEMHEYLKHQFLSRKIEVLGEQIIYTKSTTKLNTVEFEEYNERCRALASEQGVFVPLPNEEI